MKWSRRLVVCALACGMSTACGGSSKEKKAEKGPCADIECAAGTVCNPDIGACEVDAEEVCGEGTQWTPGHQAFRDASADWHLDQLHANGQRISVTDIDGDGWADLSVRRAGSKHDDFSDGGTRASWLLHNTGQGSFEDVTKASGLVKSRVSGNDDIGRPIDIIIWGDVDNDGDLDAYTAFDKQQANGVVEDSAEIMLNNGDGTFSFGPLNSEARHANKPDSPGGAAFVDVNRDGILDLWIAQFAINNVPAQDRLLIGEGGGLFHDATAEYGLTTAPWNNLQTLNDAEAHSLAWSAAACDLNGDGTPELLAASYGRAPNHLFVGQRADDGTVTYTNDSKASGYAYDDRMDWTDNESARCYCKLHPDAEDCDGVPAPRVVCNSDSDVLRWDHAHDREPYRLGGNSGTTVCADVDNDGWPDLLTSEIVHWDVGSSSDPSELLYNQKDPAVRFKRPGNDATGLTRTHESQSWNDGDITAAVFDFDNDGRKDVLINSTDYPGTRAHLWHQKPDGTFEVVPIDQGIDHTSSHGVGVADFDHDGDLDLVLGHSRFRCSSGNHCYPPDKAYARLYENTVGQDGNWLQVDLQGKDGTTNHFAVGARVTVKTDAMTQISDVDGGHGHYGIEDEMTRHFGLGSACRATVTVRWPDENLDEETFVLPAGHRYHWKQGEVPTVEDN